MSDVEQSSSGIWLIGILILVGFLIGWGGSSYLNNIPVSQTSNQAQNITDSNVLVEAEKNSGSGLIDDLESAESSGEIQDKDLPAPLQDGVEKLLDLVLLDSSDYQLTAQRVIDYLTALSKLPGRGILKEKALRKLLRDVPEIDFALIDMYGDIENDDAKTKLGFILMINNSNQRPFLEPKLMEKIRLGESRSEMLALLADWGLQAKSNIAYLAKEIAYMEKPEDIGSTIQAISRSSWVGRSALQPADMEHLSEMMRNYRQSEYEVVRAAGVAALQSFPTDNFNEALIRAMDDPSEAVRGRAMELYFNNQFDSPELRNKLVARVQDNSLSYMERSSVAGYLMRMELPVEQMQAIKDAQAELQKYLESLSEEELQAMYSN